MSKIFLSNTKKGQKTYNIFLISHIDCKYFPQLIAVRVSHYQDFTVVFVLLLLFSVMWLDDNCSKSVINRPEIRDGGAHAISRNGAAAFNAINSVK